MTKRSPLSPYRCTARGGTGNLCGAETISGAPFPLCKFHAKKIYDFLLEKYPPRDPTTAELKLDMIESARDRVNAKEALFKAAAKAQSVVYYVPIHDYIKIGVTTNVRLRMSQLRTDADAVLATEPGDYRLESRRHKQFAAERIGRRENFEPSERLMAHIAQVREENGPPNITTWPSIRQSA